MLVGICNAEQPAPSVVVRGADAALSRSLRSVSVAISTALAAKCRLAAEVEALKAFGTVQYGARVVQVPETLKPLNPEVSVKAHFSNLG